MLALLLFRVFAQVIGGLQIRARDAIGRTLTASRELSADVGQLLLRRNLLGEQRSLDALDKALQPAHQLGLGHLKLSLAGRMVLRKRKYQAI